MTEMYQVALFFRGGGNQVTLQYLSATKAEEVYREVYTLLTAEDGGVRGAELEDNYGCRLTVTRDAVAAVMMQDTGRALDGASELGLMNARAQSKAMRRAQSDPMIDKPRAAAPLALPPGFKFPQ